MGIQDVTTHDALVTKHALDERQVATLLEARVHRMRGCSASALGRHDEAREAFAESMQALANEPATSPVPVAMVEFLGSLLREHYDHPTP